ncbi:MAG: FAD-dependent monooxygenase [Nanoarchaeota archaeon]|nr:FAD-dependent monooxygenase [Nanoarchaeota archaeon]
MGKGNYDVIILGAGPAGLSLASVLSRQNKVCVIEKRRIGFTTKSWGSFRDLIRKLKLNDCVANDKINFLQFNHYLGAKWLFKDTYCQLYENKLLREFINRCDKDTTFIQNSYVRDFRRKDGGISIKTGKKTLWAKLLIDCTGASSPIIKKYRLIDNYSSFPILGYNLKGIKVDPTKFIWDVMKIPGLDEIMVGGVMPYSDKMAQVHVFPYLKNKTMQSSSLEKYLKTFMSSYPGLKGAKKVSRTRGTILMGELKKNALDNIFFFGEAGLWSPRFTGAGVNQILMDHQAVGKELSRLIKEDRLSAGFLSEIRPLTQEKRMLHLLRCFENIVLSFKDKPERLNEFLVVLNESHAKFGKYLMRNKFNALVLKNSWKKVHEHFSTMELVKMLPKQDILFLFELGTELIEDEVLKKYRKHLKDI